MDRAVYVKTPKGLEEMTTRKHRLSIKERHVLIMLNGQRTRAEVVATLPDLEHTAIFERLLAEQFIRPLQPAQAAVAAPVKKTIPFTRPERTKAPAPAPAPLDEAERFQMAGNFMANTLNAFIGLSGSSLLQRIDVVQTLEELRELYDPWRNAMALSAEGRKELPALDQRLAALLS